MDRNTVKDSDSNSGRDTVKDSDSDRDTVKDSDSDRERKKAEWPWHNKGFMVSANQIKIE